MNTFHKTRKVNKNTAVLLADDGEYIIWKSCFKLQNFFSIQTVLKIQT